LLKKEGYSFSIDWLLKMCDTGAADLFVKAKVTLQIAAVDMPPHRSAFNRCALFTRREGVIYRIIQQGS
jgi:hypothetical protein